MHKIVQCVLDDGCDWIDLIYLGTEVVLEAYWIVVMQSRALSAGLDGDEVELSIWRCQLHEMYRATTSMRLEKIAEARRERYARLLSVDNDANRFWELVERLGFLAIPKRETAREAWDRSIQLLALAELLRDTAPVERDAVRFRKILWKV